VRHSRIPAYARRDRWTVAFCELNPHACITREEQARIDVRRPSARQERRRFRESPQALGITAATNNVQVAAPAGIITIAAVRGGARLMQRALDCARQAP